HLGLGRILEPTIHDAPFEPGAMGAPVFDDTWSVIGLHKGHDEQGRRTFVPISRLTRELEQAPCWEEIANVHSLVRDVDTTRQTIPQPEVPSLVRAVHWNPDDTQPMSERERRRAFAGATLDQLRTARGGDAASTSEQRAVDAILNGPPYDLSE